MTLEELRKQQIEDVRRKKIEAKRKRKKRMLFLFPCLLLLLIGGFLAWQIAMNQHFEITRYYIEGKELETPIKVALLSDLHSMEYGVGNSELIEAIQKEKPDFIAMAGDMVNSDDTDFTVIRHLCRELGEVAPVYYTLGNHEGTLMYQRMDSVALDKLLEEDGVTVLINQVSTFEKGDVTISIAGISNEAAGYDQWAEEKMEDFWKLDGYKMVLSHFPDLYYDKLKDAPFDLAVAGHYHGGIARIPGKGGLYHPEEGFFPKYSGGQYSLKNGSLIVSRGIGEHGWLPRINNRPELVMIQIR